MKWLIPLFLLFLFSIANVDASFLLSLLSKAIGPAVKAGINAAKTAAKNAIKEQIRKKKEEMRRKKREAEDKRRAEKKARRRKREPHEKKKGKPGKPVIPEATSDLDDIDRELMENLIEWHAYNIDEDVVKEKINRIHDKDVREVLSDENMRH